MNKIKFNNTEFEVESYNKSTYFNSESMSSNANCTLLTNNITGLNALAEESITSIQITHDNELIYDLQNINARIDNINEYLNGDRIGITIGLTFSNT